MPKDELGNGNGKLTIQPGVLPIPRVDQTVVYAKISGVPHTAGTLNYRIDGATEEQIFIVPDSILRGSLAPESAYDSVFFTLCISSSLGECEDSKNPKLVVCEGEKEIGCIKLSLAPEASDLVANSNSAAESQNILEHREIVLARIKASQIEPRESAPPADKSSLLESAPNDANNGEGGATESKKDDTAPTDNASAAEGASSPSTSGESPIETDQGDGHSEPGSEMKKDAPANTAPTDTASAIEGAGSTEDDAPIETDQGNGAGSNPPKEELPPNESHSMVSHGIGPDRSTSIQIVSTAAGMKPAEPVPTIPAVEPAAESSAATTQAAAEIEEHPAVPAVSETQTVVSNGHGRTTVDVRVATSDGSRVNLGAITVEPVNNVANGATISSNGTAGADTQTAPEADKSKMGQYPAITIAFIFIAAILLIIAFISSAGMLPKGVMAPCIIGIASAVSMAIGSARWRKAPSFNYGVIWAIIFGIISIFSIFGGR